MFLNKVWRRYISGPWKPGCCSTPGKKSGKFLMNPINAYEKCWKGRKFYVRTQAAPLLVLFWFAFIFLLFACYHRSSTHAWCLFVFTPNQNLIPRALIHLTFISSTQVLKPTTSESDAQGLVFWCWSHNYFQYAVSLNMDREGLTLIPLGYFEDLSPLGGGGGGVFRPPPPLRSRQLMDRLTWKLAQS